MTVSVIMTVRNEESTIAPLLDSLLAQTRPPDEIVICDGGSTDGTTDIVRGYVRRGHAISLIEAPAANISKGRNLAIAAAAGDVIASTDAGVRLVSGWLEQLTLPFTAAPAENPIAVASGFFVADPHGVFETAMGATVLPDLADIKPDAFLPSSRSVAFTKAAWSAVGGYPEWLDYCEDLVFDINLRRAGLNFAFAPGAVAYFRPRSSLKAFFTQYYRYARGDGKADLWRKRHVIRYVTYVAAPLAMLLALRYNVLVVWPLLAAAALGYCWRPWQRLRPRLHGWSIANKVYAVALIPTIRFAGDVAKMLGYPVGVWWRIKNRPPRG